MSRCERSKVTVIGAGNVGSNVAQRLVEKELCDVVLVDVIEGLPQGKALDLLESGPLQDYDSILTGSNSYEASENSDIIVVTAGLARKPGMSRDDLLLKNAAIVRDVVEAAARQSPRAVILVVSNPLDAMCHVAMWASHFPRQRVIGMAGVLDSARLRTFIAQELEVSVESTQAFVLGGHGDTMVPMVRYSTVGGIPITELLPKEKVDALIKRTRQGGAEIVQLLKTGSAFYAPSAAVAEMVESILHDERKILPCAAYLQGEYGIKNLFMGVPVKLGCTGIETVLEINLTSEEKSALEKSAAAVQELVDVLKKNDFLN
jgi:malate dehydrogenase